MLFLWSMSDIKYEWVYYSKGMQIRHLHFQCVWNAWTCQKICHSALNIRYSVHLLSIQNVIWWSLKSIFNILVKSKFFWTHTMQYSSYPWCIPVFFKLLLDLLCFNWSPVPLLVPSPSWDVKILAISVFEDSLSICS